MHELSLVESVLEIVEQYREREKFRRVNSIRLSFGRLSCIEPQALRFAYEVRTKGTPLAGASLEFDVLPAVVHCFHCEQDLEIQGAYAAVCPRCRGEEVVLAGGTEELRLLELDVD
jgi:hydrogenase nickel incorporation protein HypA/HybF